MNEIVNELKQLHKTAYLGYSPWITWENLKTAAHNNGLVPSIERNLNRLEQAPYLVTYTNKSGEKVPIMTEIAVNGKARTYVSGDRVPGTSFTVDLIWQAKALNKAVMISRGVKYHFNMREHGIFCDGYKDRDGLDVGDTFAYNLKAWLFGRPGRDMGKDDLGLLIKQFTSDELNHLSKSLQDKSKDELMQSGGEAVKNLLSRVDALGLERRFGRSSFRT